MREKMKIKKIILLITIALSVLSLSLFASCGGDSSSGGGDGKGSGVHTGLWGYVLARDVKALFWAALAAELFLWRMLNCIQAEPR